jgi:hypothetical protein
MALAIEPEFLLQIMLDVRGFDRLECDMSLIQIVDKTTGYRDSAPGSVWGIPSFFQMFGDPLFGDPRLRQLTGRLFG